ncbi:hypothetical protein [Aeromicrobium wangtongii]|uniref:Uncharacterized protein n=1 Tax=Aeromicrobium wangtongii TaxID=2969247 RepID=A0ABY5MDI8_9ACTN|nr:hypothetical protein [Aeromicrobium wangtongii]MCD9197773.1 hypothetical protein [Aeromicrobium wangtongii]UUP15256.1 hypothetical protein NQV15_08080 [Aeromicrobium wangtongii]
MMRVNYLKALLQAADPPDTTSVIIRSPTPWFGLELAFGPGSECRGESPEVFVGQDVVADDAVPERASGGDHIGGPGRGDGPAPVGGLGEPRRSTRQDIGFDSDSDIGVNGCEISSFRPVPHALAAPTLGV